MNDTSIVYDGKGTKLVLGPQDHLATGGEGRVYARQAQVYKLYLDPAKAVQARLPDKVAALQALAHPGIATPQGLLHDRDGQFVGISLPRVHGEALCKLFTNTWRDAHQFGTTETTALAQAMRRVVDHAHAHQALVVDGNELNWLVDGVSPVAIDVDGWQLPGFPAGAIMASIKDPLMNGGFSTDSDWFAWAVTTFQLWTGIHPYKGSHPDFARGALAERMAAGISVFDARATLPAAARPIAEIPPALRSWYEAVFQRAARAAPPGAWTAAPAPQTAPRLKLSTLPSGLLRQTRRGHTGGRVLAALSGCLLVRTRTGLRLWDALREQDCAWVASVDVQALLNRQAALLRTSAGTLSVITLRPGQGLQLQTEEQATQPGTLALQAAALWQGGNRVFALQEGVSNGLVEIAPATLAGRPRLVVDKAWPVNTLSSSFFDRCFVQDCLGTPFVGLLEGQGLLQLKAPALQGLRVIQALGIDRHNVWLTAVRKSDGQTLRLRLGAGPTQFELQLEEPVCDTGLDAAVLATGVGVLRLGDSLRIVRHAQARTLDGCGLPAAARLFAIGPQLGLYEDSEVSQLSLQ